MTTRISLALIFALSAVACGGQTTPPSTDPCAAELDACRAECPVNAGPGATAADSCAASCRAEHGLCVAPPPPALSCARVESAPHACASSGCWASLACNRDPSAELGLTCESAGEGVWSCRW